MDLSAIVQITQKGVDEVARRTYKLSIKKRNVLFLLTAPQTIGDLLQKIVFPHDEIIEEIRSLLREEFIVVAGDFDASRPEHPAAPVAAAPRSTDNYHLLDDIVISEAKFLLIDFCVDSFGTKSQEFADGIRTCSSAANLNLILKNIVTAVKKDCPARIATLLSLVDEINQTAD